MFWNIYNEIFPSLWSLDYVECRQKFEKMVFLTKIGAWFITMAVLLISTAGLPWYGDEYEVFFPVKVAVDYFHKYVLHLYLFIFYSMFYHVGLTIISTLFCITYFILHLYYQFCMLNEKLNTLSDSCGQDLVRQELITCIKLHQTLLKYKSKL